MAEIEHVSIAKMEALLGYHSLGSLAAVATQKNHPGREIIDTTCSECGTPLQAMRLFSAVTACDECRGNWEKEEAARRVKEYWLDVCPPRYRDTSKTHPAFPVAPYAATGAWLGQESLLLYGPQRTGKTRLAMLLLKRVLLRGKRPGVLWPEAFRALKFHREPDKAVAYWGGFDVLLLDDALLVACSSDVLTDFLKELIDYRMRYNRHTILTSQIGSTDYKDAAAKFKEAKGADTARIEALLQRVNEEFRVVPFGAMPAPEDAGTFSF